MRHMPLALLVLAAGCTTQDASGLAPLDTPEQQVTSEASTRAEVDLLIATLDGIGDVDLTALAPGDRSAPVADVIMANPDARWGGCAVAHDISGRGDGVAAPSIVFNACSGPRDVTATGTINFQVPFI